MSSLAIVGAGPAGLAAAAALRRLPGLSITMLEKSRGLAGRAATRWRDRGNERLRFDHGANYITLEPNTRAEALVLEMLPGATRVRIEAPVWTFNGAGEVAPGDKEANARDRWTYREGINHLGHLLAEHAADGRAEVSIRRRTRAARLERAGPRWWVHDTEAVPYGPFDAVLLTPPAPQTATLLADSTLDDDNLAVALARALAEAAYCSQFALVLGFDDRLNRPGGAYALLNTDQEHDVAWLSFEECKPGHVPTGSVIIAQMSPGWTADHFEDDSAALLGAGLAAVRDVLGDDLPEPDWSDAQRWRYALPDTAANADALRAGESRGLVMAGDFVSGTGRVAAALESGLDAADRLALLLTE